MGGKKRKLQALEAKQKQVHRRHSDAPQRSKKHAAPPLPQKKSKPAKDKPVSKQHQIPTIPFAPQDRILLIGEGDLSFAAALVKHYGCGDVIATVQEGSEAELVEKYPQAAENIQTILAGPPAKPKSDDNDPSSEDDDDEDKPTSDTPPHKNKIIYDIDATKPLPASITRPPPKRIIFNFPHTGGKSTDVNRQVRHNQSLLVGFFTASLRTLAPAGSITITLFEGEPYTLWNVRDLGRHAGLQVDKSFVFQANAYPGYRHARTLGVVRNKDGEESGWRGEERKARSYVFVRKEEEVDPYADVGWPDRRDRKKRRRGDDSDSDDEA